MINQQDITILGVLTLPYLSSTEMSYTVILLQAYVMSNLSYWSKSVQYCMLILMYKCVFIHVCIVQQCVCIISYICRYITNHVYIIYPLDGG